MRSFIIFAILLMAGLSFAVNVTGCTNITSSGVYELTTDIVGANISVTPGHGVEKLACVRVSTSDVVLDCKGFSITNNGSGSYGLLLEETNGSLLTNVTVKNCIIFGYNETGLILYNATGSLITNNTVSGSMQGIILDVSSGNNVTNNTAEENILVDFSVELEEEQYCNNVVEDMIGSGGREILYANGTVTWSDREASEVFLCNADGSTLTNITIRGSDTLNNNGVLLFYTDDATIQNSNSSNNAIGIGLGVSHNNTITNNTAYSNTEPIGYIPDTPFLGGFWLLGSSDNTFSDNTANENAQFGFMILNGSNGNLFNGNIACDNNLSGFAVYLSRDNVFSNDIACSNNPDNYSVTFPGEDGGENLTLPIGGFFIAPITNTTLFNVTAYDNQYAGLMDLQILENGEEEHLPTTVIDSSFYDNGWDIVKATILNESMLLSNTEVGTTPISIIARPLYVITEDNGDVNIRAAVYQIDGTTSPGSPPSGYESFRGKYVKIFPGIEIGNESDEFSPIHFQTLTFHWEEAEICGVETAYNESTMVLYTWDGSSWIETPNQFLNIEDNRLVAVNVFNITEADIYGLFAETIDPDDCESPCPPCNGNGDEDDDDDGVINGQDLCSGSVLDNIVLKPNNYAQNGEFDAFESGPNNDQSLVYDMETAKGCSCKQIVQELGAGEGQLKNGCSPSLMEEWTGLSGEMDRRTGVGKKAGLEGLPSTPLLIGILAGVGLLVFIVEAFIRRRHHK